MKPRTTKWWLASTTLAELDYRTNILVDHYYALDAEEEAAIEGRIETEACPVEVAEALGLYAYNRSPSEWVQAVYPGSHPSYIEEKTRTARYGFWAFYDALDSGNRQVLVDAAMDAYFEEARLRFRGTP